MEPSSCFRPWGTEGRREQETNRGWLVGVLVAGGVASVVPAQAHKERAGGVVPPKPGRTRAPRPRVVDVSRYVRIGSGKQRNPGGPSGGTGRVLRGGSWFSLAKYCRSASHCDSWPDCRDFSLGFRLSRSIPGFVQPRPERLAAVRGQEAAWDCSDLVSDDDFAWAHRGLMKAMISRNTAEASMSCIISWPLRSNQTISRIGELTFS